MEHIQQRKVGGLVTYLLSPKKEIQLMCLTETSLEKESITIQDTNGIITGTGTTGDTLIRSIGSTGMNVSGIILCTTIMAVLLAHVLDRNLNLKYHNQDLDLDNQEKQ